MKTLTSKIPVEMYVDYGTGGAMMIRCTVLKITGLLKKIILCITMRLISHIELKSGFQILCMRDAIVRDISHDFDKLNKTGNNLMYYYVVETNIYILRNFTFISTLVYLY
jgi:hypothetical protein